LRNFVITNVGKSRSNIAGDVFRPDYRLPTMSIDEYLDEEMRRGGIIQGGSNPAPVLDEDSYDVADAETTKARNWDEFTEHNPKGKDSLSVLFIHLC
jgi:immunoglobulin-binding protein 1